MLNVAGGCAAVACYRRWTHEADDPKQSKTVLARVANSVRGGVNFRSSRDEYLAWWFDPHTPPQAINREHIWLEVDSLGVLPLFVGKAPDGWLVNSRLPPYLGSGWHQARMKLAGSRWSDSVRFAVDVEPLAGNLAIQKICDGVTWEQGALDISRQPAYLSVWVAGLADNADVTNVVIEADGSPLKVVFVGDEDAAGLRQINAAWPKLGAGSYAVTLRHAGAISAPARMTARVY